jgi:pimeloyl-ACP methyl ester carboxylesterase
MRAAPLAAVLLTFGSTFAFAGRALDELVSQSDGLPSEAAAPSTRPGPRTDGDALVGWDLSQVQEAKRLGPGRHAALLAVGGFDPSREPLILIHGIFGSPADMQPVANRLRGGRYQIFVLAYADLSRGPERSGQDLAEELAALSRRLGAGRPLTIVAHSMGGIVTRAALNAAAASGELASWSHVRAVCVDTPWQGFPGPGGEMTMPAGLGDMRAKSPMYAGGLLKKPLGDNVDMELVFAREGSAALDYTEPPVSELPGKLAAYYASETPVRGEARVMNFWQALIWSSEYWPLQEELRAKADAGRLDEAAVKEALLRRYPRFPGDHTGVLRASGPDSLLEHLAAELQPGS